MAADTRTASNKASKVDSKTAQRLAQKSRPTNLQYASDALWRTIQTEQYMGRDPDPDLLQAHALVQQVISRWQGGE